MSEDKPVEVATEPKPKKKKKGLVVLLTILGIVVVAGIGLFVWHNQPSFCNAICHTPMDPYGDTYFQEPGVAGVDKWGNQIESTSGMMSVTHRVEGVTCMDCLSECNFGAMKYRLAVSPKGKSPILQEGKGEASDAGRRAFLAGSLIAVGTAAVKAQEMKMDGGLAEIIDKKVPERQTRITPPGSQSARNMYSHCTACQLCVDNCPNNVLRPSTDLKHFMQPESSYEQGYCRPECTTCSDVCPVGAIHPITVEEKSSTQIGHAVWVRDNCVVLSDGVLCGNCARHCPTGAIQMVNTEGFSKFKDRRGRDIRLQIPVVDEERCIGCGACENLCPSRPFSAIYVEGHQVHKTI